LLRWEGDGRETLRPVRCTQPLAIVNDVPPVNFIRPRGTLYFTVPPEVERFAVIVAGSGTAETVKAVVRDPSGTLVAQQDNIAAPHAFLLKPRTNTSGPWSLSFERASDGVLEDVFVQLAGIPPVMTCALD
jgi:hypothetical protein